MTVAPYTPEKFAADMPRNLVFPNLKPGDVMELAAGVYAFGKIQNSAKLGEVVIQNKAGDVVTITGISFSAARGYTLRSNPAGGVVHANYVGIETGSESITLGPGLDIHSTDLGDDPTKWIGGGIGIRNAKNVRVTGNQIHHGNGITYEGNNGVLVDLNHIHHIAADGMSGCFADNFTARRNFIHDLFPSSKLHADGIQGNTMRRTTPIVGLVIAENVVVRGAGLPVQGGFFGDEASVTYIEPRIEGNLFATSNWWGIGSRNFVRPQIVDNYILDESDAADGVLGNDPEIMDGAQDMVSWLRLTASTDATVTGNYIPSGAPWNDGGTGGVWAPNFKSPAVRKGDFSPGLAWYEARTGVKLSIGTAAPPPVVQEPPPAPAPLPAPPAPVPAPAAPPSARDAAILASLDKAELEVRATSNAANRALYAIKKARDALA